MKYSLPKGTFDITPMQLQEEDAWKISDRWDYLENILKNTARDYGYKEIRTPIFESTDLFIRGVGDSSDIVTKEMYTFEDKGDRSLTLRPEGTAPVIRAFIENHLQQFGSYHKLFYVGPYFRYDRPQAGRFRQFHQFGVEAIGRSDPWQDVEVIDLICECYRRLGIKNLNVLINSVGDETSRQHYKQALKEFLIPHIKELSKDSQERFHKNPLRILDSKDTEDKKILTSAPQLKDFLTAECSAHFEQVCNLLSRLKITFTIDSHLVRGLDYYNKTVFEVTSSVLGAQNSIGAGGRYDGLIKQLGGQDLPSIGFATGLERILSTMQGQNIAFPSSKATFCYIFPLDESCIEKALELGCKLRHEGVSTEIDLRNKKIQKALQDATSAQIDYMIILGSEELSKGVFQIKNMKKRSTQEIPFNEVISFMKSQKESSTHVLNSTT